MWPRALLQKSYGVSLALVALVARVSARGSEIVKFMHAMMGKTEPDPFGVLLKTGYEQFQAHCGINGLAKEIDGELHVLAVGTKTPGKGQFRNFIRLAKKNYCKIFVWEVWNPELEKALARYGFGHCSQTDEDGVVNTGMRWVLKL